MVRNFTSLKRFACRPKRSWMKKRGPFESSLTAIAISTRKGAKKISPRIAISRLTARPTARSNRDFLKSGEKIRLLGVSDSMAIFPVSRS